DTGKGMDPGDRERIFQEFTRLPGAQGEEGFGLGLSIVRMLVQLLEGRIEVDSVIGKWSTFTLRVRLNPVAFDNDTSALKEQPSDDSQNQKPAL
ncbi:UNVERIFIED_CONTAM: ATP-binding protein, partial [Prevotella sp. 15_C9]